MPVIYFFLVLAIFYKHVSRSMQTVLSLFRKIHTKYNSIFMLNDNSFKDNNVTENYTPVLLRSFL